MGFISISLKKPTRFTRVFHAMARNLTVIDVLILRVLYEEKVCLINISMITFLV
jgi:hypothetical protein